MGLGLEPLAIVSWFWFWALCLFLFLLFFFFGPLGLLALKCLSPKYQTGPSLRSSPGLRHETDPKKAGPGLGWSNSAH